MRRLRTLARVLVLTCTLILTGCAISRPAIERQTVWATMGTPARITDDREVEHLIRVDGELVPSRGVLRGMVAIDEPTLNYYRALHEKRGAKEKDGWIRKEGE